ncbi:IS1/IS1595 family N-terminal zinc-binding domain-containing protein [Clostridium folliculivorans]|uniref:Transposase n=1 Tax=Clostridium folliculivorans TaxID=2886038 RepID=A0A9W5XZY0_9CLOT|nr:hypothetical protein [Clostridium folliculivorans]GKU24025.1 transposase [Clostridium folliculivorans]GKU30140.1 transposase [Clostridium folliculivorans]
MINQDIKFERLDSHINQTLKKDLYDNRIVSHCPSCKCREYIKYGFYKGIQRYKCKVCGITFSKTTNSLWSYSKKDTRTWMEFIELLLEKKSLRFCAKKLNISLVTAFYWRHKILHSINLDITPDKLSGVVHVGKTIVRENFKGSRNIKSFNLNRDCPVNLRKNVWIIGAKGDDDSLFIKPLFNSCWNLTTFNIKLYSKIEENSYIVHYGDRHLSQVARKHNKKRVLKVESYNNLRYFRSNIKKWFEVFHGVATKYLQRYLSFFVLFKLTLPINSVNLMFHNLLNGDKFIKTSKIRIIKNHLY